MHSVIDPPEPQIGTRTAHGLNAARVKQVLGEVIRQNSHSVARPLLFS